MERKNIFDDGRNRSRKATYYIILGVCVLVIGIASVLSYQSIQNSTKTEEPATLDNTPDVTQTTETEKQVTDVTDTKPQQQTGTDTTVKEEPEAAVETKAYMMPVNGEITVGFSLENPVYSATLKDWRVHDGIDISAQLGTNVVAVNDGVIEKIDQDDLYGIVVTVKHTDGKKSTYAGLDDSIELEEGQIINRGDIIGQVGNTAIFEIGDGPHLHFEMSENGNKINPLSVIKQ